MVQMLKLISPPTHPNHKISTNLLRRYEAISQQFYLVLFCWVMASFFVDSYELFTHIDGLAQDCRNSIVKLQPCTKPSICLMVASVVLCYYWRSASEEIPEIFWKIERYHIAATNTNTRWTTAYIYIYIYMYIFRYAFTRHTALLQRASTMESYVL